MESKGFAVGSCIGTYPLTIFLYCGIIFPLSLYLLFPGGTPFVFYLRERDVKMKTSLAIVGDLAYETTINRFHTFSQLGGSGYYTAVGAIGAKNNDFVLISSVGEDFSFERIKINKSNLLIDIVPRQKTACFTTTYINNSERSFFADFGALNYPPYRFVDDFITAQLIYFAGSNPHRQISWIHALLGKGYNGIIACDTFEKYCVDYPDIVMKVIEKSEIVFMNQFEQSILNYKPEKSKKTSIIKKGENGADLFIPQRDIAHFIPTIEYNAEDTNGAGDILGGFFLSLILNGMDYGIALQQSVDFASLSVSKKGVEHLFNT